MAHSLFGELLASCKQILSESFPASLTPLGMKWARTCADSFMLKSLARALSAVLHVFWLLVLWSEDELPVSV